MSAATKLRSEIDLISATFGNFTDEVWADRRTLTWPELVALLTAHAPGRKEGSCIVPAVFRGQRRQKADADQIDAAFLNSDSGATLAEIAEAARRHGWAAIISSTHSHLTTATKAKLSNWHKFIADCPIGGATAFLIDKGMLPRVAADAVIEREDGEFIYLRHQPCPKFRIVLPLRRPWKAADHRSQDVANAAWKERIKALAATLGLQHNQACTDTSRLFYLPRRPHNGPPAETAIISGAPCDIFALSAPETPLTTAAAKAKAARTDLDAAEHIDTATGEVIDLRQWARTYGDKFLIADALRARRPSALTGRVADSVKVHCRCPNEDAHTEPGADGATFVTNAGHANNKGFVFHCRHAHCDGKDRLFFVKQMLAEGWLSAADLTDQQFLVRPAEDDGDQRHGNGASDKPPSGRSPGIWPSPLDFFADQDGAPPELRPEHLPAALCGFVKDASERMGVDPTSVAMGCLVACAAVISDDWSIQPKRHDPTWTENPRLWAAIVGDPSILKTPVIAVCTRPIDHLDAEARSRHQQDMQDHKAALAAWKAAEHNDGTPEPKAPKLARYMVEGATVEAISEALRDDAEARQYAPAGKVLSRHDEMSEFFGNLDRYKAGGRGSGDRGAYLRLYNGGRYTIDRIARGSFAVPNWSACFLGGIQPGPIQKIAKDTSDDGLLQRFIYCVPAWQQPGLDRAPDITAARRYEALLPRLAGMRPPKLIGGSSSNVVVLHDRAHQYREDIDALARAMAALPDTSPRLRATFGKWSGLFARLCLTFHLIEVADAAPVSAQAPYVDVVSEETARRAAAFMQDIVLPHLLRAEAMMFRSVQTSHAQWIAGHILAHGLERITSRDVVRAYGALRAPEARDELAAVMAGLVTIGWLEPEIPANSAKPVWAWRVNPAVHVAFAARAAREHDLREKAREAIAADIEVLRRKRRETQT